MLSQIKKALPGPLRLVLIYIKQRTYDYWQRKILFNRMQAKHTEKIKQLKGKKKIKVVFLAIHKSVWKVDHIFQKMLKDSYFEPEILVCPYTQYGEERMTEDMNLTYNYFNEKGYPVKKSKIVEGWIKLDDLKPDIVFFTNPHDLTVHEYYENAYFNYLSCYVPYYFMATKHAGGDAEVLNTNIFVSAWKLYWATQYTEVLNENISPSKGVNSDCFGYPGVESLLQLAESDNVSAWKVQGERKKRIIFSPHHTIEKTINALSSFLLFGESIKNIAIKNKDKVQWSFKPHPILKTKLYLHPDWGVKKTDEYYDFWERQSFTQLDEGEYENLFLGSDAIIHDCSSFIVEYAFTRKPCLYLVNENNLKGLLNDFGKGVMQVYEQARSVENIECFISDVVKETISIDECKRAYFDIYFEKYYKNKLPSDCIIEDIKLSLGVLSDN
jgi:hypothetical protein